MRYLKSQFRRGSAAMSAALEMQNIAARCAAMEFSAPERKRICINLSQRFSLRQFNTDEMKHGRRNLPNSGCNRTDSKAEPITDGMNS